MIRAHRTGQGNPTRLVFHTSETPWDTEHREKPKLGQYRLLSHHEFKLNVNVFQAVSVSFATGLGVVQELTEMQP